MEKSDIDAIYEVIGKLAVKYSQIEYLTEYALNLMIAQNDFMVEPLLVRPLNFSRKIDLIKQCIDYHFSEAPEKRDKNKDIFNRIDKIRCFRNNLIHGDWDIDNYVSNNNLIIIRSYKLKYNKKEDVWTDLKEDRYSINDMKERYDEVQSLIEELRGVLPEYKELETRPWLDTASAEDLQKFKDEIGKLASDET